jgi:hypothetical protein
MRLAVLHLDIKLRANDLPLQRIHTELDYNIENFFVGTCCTVKIGMEFHSFKRMSSFQLTKYS